MVDVLDNEIMIDDRVALVVSDYSKLAVGKVTRINSDTVEVLYNKGNLKCKILRNSDQVVIIPE